MKGDELIGLKNWQRDRGVVQDVEESRADRVLVPAEAILQDAFQVYADRSLDRKMMQKQAKRLNEFYASALCKGKAAGFRSLKNESTLAMYFRRISSLPYGNKMRRGRKSQSMKRIRTSAT